MTTGEKVATLTVTLAQAALVHPLVVLRALAKYVVVTAGLTDNVRPVPAGNWPQEPVNQSIVSPAPALAEMVLEPPGTMNAELAAALAGVAGRVPAGMVNAQVELVTEPHVPVTIQRKVLPAIAVVAVTYVGVLPPVPTATFAYAAMPSVLSCH